ncbi:MAG TPA: hypothetical protein VIE66_08115 [Methylocella sp.]
MAPPSSDRTKSGESYAGQEEAAQSAAGRSGRYYSVRIVAEKHNFVGQTGQAISMVTDPSTCGHGICSFLLVIFITDLYYSDGESVEEREMNKLDRPREIIEYCLKPLALTTTTDEYKEVYRRLEHVIKTLQVMVAREKKPVAIDFSNMRTININEAAHGDDA